jgi:hypothetical protein
MAQVCKTAGIFAGKGERIEIVLETDQTQGTSLGTVSPFGRARNSELPPWHWWRRRGQRPRSPIRPALSESTKRAASADCWM